METSKEARQARKAITAARAIAHLIDTLTDDPQFPTITDQLTGYQTAVRWLTGPDAETWWNVVATQHQLDQQLDQRPTYTTTRPMILVIIDTRIQALTLAAAGDQALFAGLV